MDGPHVVVSVDTVFEAMMQRLGADLRLQGSEPTIKKLPAELRAGDLYDPKLFSIGPLHRHRMANNNVEINSHLKAMDAIKWFTLQDRLYGPHLQDSEQVLQLLINRIKLIEMRARNQYPREDIVTQMNSDEFVSMMIVDGFFILEVLMMHRAEDKMPYRLIEIGISPSQVRRDLLLLENQIPFFVLMELFECFRELGLVRAPGVTLWTLVFNYFWTAKELRHSDQDLPFNEAIHLLHLYYLWVRSEPPAAVQQASAMCKMLRSIATPLRATVMVISGILINLLLCPFVFIGFLFWGHSFSFVYLPEGYIPAARQLIDAGINLTRATTRPDSCSIRGLFDFRIDVFNARLVIPTLYLNELNKPLLANLRAFEASSGVHPNPNRRQQIDICTYVWLMSSLIKTKEDVTFLRKNGIIVNEVGNDEDIFGYFRDVSKSNPKRSVSKEEVSVLGKDAVSLLLKLYNHPAFWRISFARKYISNPWAMFALIASTIALFFSAYSNFHHKK